MKITRDAPMTAMSFNTENQTFSNLLGRPAVYRVPPFQRDYSWSEDHWDDFWQDTIEVTSSDEEESHYMGYLVLQSSNNKSYNIIDGQQRITTISLVILAGIRYLDELITHGIDSENNLKRKERFLSLYITFIDPITLNQVSKLELNRHNNTFYQTFLVELEKIPQRGLNSSEHKLRKASLWFQDKISSHLGRNEGSGLDFANFITKLLDRLFFTVITVTDELNAFKVFETLNARGVRLSSTDLLKNLLFSSIVEENIHETKFRALEDKWERIVGYLGQESLPEFLRYYWNSKNKLVRKNDLFKVVKKNINSKDQAQSFLSEMLHFSEFYSALRDPNDARWNQSERDALEQLSMFNVRQPLAMLLSCYARFFEEERKVFTSVLSAIATISFRYNVICNKKTSEQERVYSEVAIGIHNATLSTKDEIIESLQEIYPKDNEFTSAFTSKILKTNNSRNKKIVRFILFKIESYKSSTSYDFESSAYNIEHILPENPNDNWIAFSSKDHEDYVYRIGNMALMKTSDNRNIGNCKYEDKVDSYRSSAFLTTQSIPTHYSAWTHKEITTRQAALGKLASQLWKI